MASLASPDLPLVVRRLDKRYRGGVRANCEITLSARPGETLGILGPNGAGKTTLARQITAELLPTSGEIRVFGVDVVANPTAAKRLMGIVPQEAQLFEQLTVRETLRIFGKMRGLPRAAARVRADELIADLRLAEHADMPNMKLSGGLKRRVMVGIAALAKPRLIVLDEPTTGLDPQARRDMWELMRQYKADGSTILMTTHYMEEAEALCDRVGIISGGRLLALDSVERLKASQGLAYKITYAAEDAESDAPPGATRTLYGANDRELTERVRALGVRQFTLSRATLEDVYLALTSDAGGGFRPKRESVWRMAADRRKRARLFTIRRESVMIL